MSSPPCLSAAFYRQQLEYKRRYRHGRCSKTSVTVNALTECNGAQKQKEARLLQRSRAAGRAETRQALLLLLLPRVAACGEPNGGGVFDQPTTTTTTVEERRTA